MSGRGIGPGVLVLAVAWAVLGVVGPAGAQSLSPTIIAIVEYDRLMGDSAAAKSREEQLTKIGSGLQAEIDGSEKQLASEQAELEKQRSILAPEAFQQKAQELQRKVVELKARVQGINQQLDEARFNADRQIQGAIFEIVRELSLERGFNMALPAAAVVYAPGDLTITAEVMSRLNQRLPRVEVVLPQAQN